MQKKGASFLQVNVFHLFSDSINTFSTYSLGRCRCQISLWWTIAIMSTVFLRIKKSSMNNRWMNNRVLHILVLFDWPQSSMNYLLFRCTGCLAYNHDIRESVTWLDEFWSRNWTSWIWNEGVSLIVSTILNIIKIFNDVHPTM